MMLMCSEDSKEGGMDLDPVQMVQIDPNIERFVELLKIKSLQ